LKRNDFETFEKKREREREREGTGLGSNQQRVWAMPEGREGKVTLTLSWSKELEVFHNCRD